jgi:hypothetical protein
MVTFVWELWFGGWLAPRTGPPSKWSSGTHLQAEPQHSRTSPCPQVDRREHIHHHNWIEGPDFMLCASLPWGPSPLTVIPALLPDLCLDPRLTVAPPTLPHSLISSSTGTVRRGTCMYCLHILIPNLHKEA